MADANMNAALERCGFDANSATWLVTYGVQSAEELRRFSDTELTDLHKTIIRNPPPNVSSTIPRMRNVMVFKFWIDECMRTDYDPDPASFSVEELELYARLYHEYQQRVTMVSNVSIDAPEPMRKMAGWPKFKERFLTYLSQVFGMARTQLRYVVRPEEDMSSTLQEVEAYDSHDDYLFEATVLHGVHFDVDNKTVYQALKRGILDGEAAVYLKRFDKTQNGRGAYFALLDQCEGKSSFTIRKNKAYGTLREVKFNGVGRKYTLEDYTHAHKSAHTELFECGEEPNESKKVNDYLNGISDPSLEPFKGAIYADDSKMESFAETSTYLLNCLATKKAAETKDHRSISAATTTGSGLPAGFKLEDKFYKPEIFNKLSKEQKDQLKVWSAARKQSRKQRRTVKALKAKVKKLESKRSSGDADISSSEDERDNGGDQFGRQVHNRRSAKKSKKRNDDDS